MEHKKVSLVEGFLVSGVELHVRTVLGEGKGVIIFLREGFHFRTCD